jgi:hypothetical protein
VAASRLRNAGTSALGDGDLAVHQGVLEELFPKSGRLLLLLPLGVYEANPLSKTVPAEKHLPELEWQPDLSGDSPALTPLLIALQGTW